MPERRRVLVIYGTRPEAIKMAPVVEALRARPERFETIVCATAQHAHLADQMAVDLGLAPDIDLGLMLPGQQLNELAARVLAAMDEQLRAVSPDWVLVQGDTTTAMAAALAAFHRRLAVGHVEAGLRTGDLAQPFPEEANRRIVDVLAAALFAPTARAAAALRAEGTPADRIVVTGNTVVDALQRVAAKLGPVQREPEVLVTVHRRESFGTGLANVFAAVAELARRFPELRWVYPVHPNPNVRGPAHELLGDVANVELCEPFSYPELVRRLQRARLVLTDSGGIQEEAPTFGTPVLVLRATTERPEGIEAGVARLVGTDRATIAETATELLTNADAYDAMARATNPYGDGQAAQRIAAVLAGEPWQPWVP